MTENAAPVLLTEDEAASILGVKPRLMRDLRGQRRIGFVRVGRLIRYRRHDLDEFIEKHAVEARR
jgi:excisionase family DNA binding protein